MKSTNSITIIGIDPGYAITGYALLKAEKQQLSVIDYGVITTTPNQPFTERLALMHTEITRLLTTHKPTVAGIEKLFFAKNSTTAIDVAQARGVTLLALSKYCSEIHEYTPLQIKQATASYGRAQKNQIQIMMQRILQLPEPPKPDDAADALAIAWITSTQSPTTHV